jgi:hypothetical protein
MSKQFEGLLDRIEVWLARRSAKAAGAGRAGSAGGGGR